MKSDSAGDFLTPDDLDKFRPGRSKDDILADLRWRAGYLVAAECNGKSVTAIYYEVYVNPGAVYANPESHKSEGIYALFVDEKFEKFIRWFHWDHAGQAKIDDNCDWLAEATKREGPQIDELKKAVADSKAPPEHIDPGLTGAFVSLRAVGLVLGPPPADEDPEKLQKNAALCDQFNAARLKIGMTAAEVQAVLKAEPLETGKIEGGSCC
ncbi:MAG TPA: hypothetical protein VH107_03755, partial [Lacipirellulaceae bacterium]|nr:hypothetical protein [Lacipirellulaceae bacterium]